MAKRTKKKQKAHMHKAASLSNSSPEVLLERAHLLLQQEKFQDAIACFKQLLKLEERVEFLQGLQQAYRGRITALAAKSMFKEAIALLDTLVQRCPDARVDTLKLNLLLQAGSYAEAARLYSNCHDQLSPEQQAQVAALFGVLLLAGKGMKPEDFKADSPIVQIYPKALAAIDMFCTGQAEKFAEALRQIPIRSPYRDLRTLLSGLHYFSSDKARGGEILRKIALDSPYYHCASGYLTTADSAKSLLADLAATPKADRSSLPQLQGLPVSDIRVLEELARVDGNPKDLYQLVRRNERCFAKEDKLALYRHIVPFCKEQTIDILVRLPAFGLAEKCRLTALSAEHDNMPSFAVFYWKDYLARINRQDPARHAEIAMIIRRQATLMKKDRYDFPRQEVLDTMLKSLEYDPAHAPTWLDAAEYARRYQGLQQYYAIIQDAIQKLPEEVSILLAAMRAGSNRGAHKKAAGLAERVLALDPINTAALDFLVASRLEHGRKLASQKKWALAEKELLAADTQARSLRFKGRSRICLGMLLLLQNNDAGLQHIEAGQLENPSPLLGRVLVALEARLYGLPKARVKDFDSRLTQHVDATETIDPTEFNRLVSWILSFEVRHWAMLKELCQILKGYFAAGGASLDLSLAQGLSLCRALEQIDLAMALFKSSTALTKKYPESLEFQAWHLLALAWKKNQPMPPAASDKLENLFERLEKQQQFDFREYIEDILEKRELLCLYDDDPEEEQGYSIDFGPFGPPKILPDQKKPKTSAEPTKPAGRQLNLFDDQ